MFNKNYTKLVVIEGMKCNHCSNKVKESLKKIKTVKKVEVNLDSKTATIISKDIIEDNIIKNNIEDLGYDVIEIRTI